MGPRQREEQLQATLQAGSPLLLLLQLIALLYLLGLGSLVAYAAVYALA
jgi:hypothetical protein